MLAKLPLTWLKPWVPVALVSEWPPLSLRAAYAASARGTTRWLPLPMLPPLHLPLPPQFLPSLTGHFFQLFERSGWHIRVTPQFWWPRRRKTSSQAASTTTSSCRVNITVPICCREGCDLRWYLGDFLIVPSPRLEQDCVSTNSRQATQMLLVWPMKKQTSECWRKPLSWEKSLTKHLETGVKIYRFLFQISDLFSLSNNHDINN